MKRTISIAAKKLGELALPDFCPRCFWVKSHASNGLPFQIFPGIFSSIDAYSKRVVHGWFDKYNTVPIWLRELGEVIDYTDPPHHSKFDRLDEEDNIRLTGTPDGIFVRSDGSYLIVDYKTAKYTGTQDRLFPMYETQLNAYAFISENYGFNPISGLALVYMEPVTDDRVASNEEVHHEDGFSMNFTAKILEVTRNTSALRPLFAKVREISDLPTAPAGRTGCKECQRLDGIPRF